MCDDAAAAGVVGQGRGEQGSTRGGRYLCIVYMWRACVSQGPGGRRVGENKRGGALGWERAGKTAAVPSPAPIALHFFHAHAPLPDRHKQAPVLAMRARRGCGLTGPRAAAFSFWCGEALPTDGREGERKKKKSEMMQCSLFLSQSKSTRRPGLRRRPTSPGQCMRTTCSVSNSFRVPRPSHHPAVSATPLQPPLNRRARSLLLFTAPAMATNGTNGTDGERGVEVCACAVVIWALEV